MRLEICFYYRFHYTELHKVPVCTYIHKPVKRRHGYHIYFSTRVRVLAAEEHELIATIS